MEFENIKRHKLSAVFGDMGDEQFSQLLESVRDSGIRDPQITMLDGQILDGWHRHRAALGCERNGELEYVELAELDTEADPVKWVLDKNIQRRHLTTSQRALIAVGLPSLQRGQRRKDAHFALPEMAEMLAVSPRTIQYARQVDEKCDSTIKDAVRDGALSIQDAAESATVDKAIQKRALAKVLSGEYNTLKRALKDFELKPAQPTPAQPAAQPETQPQPEQPQPTGETPTPAQPEPQPSDVDDNAEPEQPDTEQPVMGEGSDGGDVEPQPEQPQPTDSPSYAEVTRQLAEALLNNGELEEQNAKAQEAIAERDNVVAELQRKLDTYESATESGGANELKQALDEIAALKVARDDAMGKLASSKRTATRNAKSLKALKSAIAKGAESNDWSEAKKLANVK